MRRMILGAPVVVLVAFAVGCKDKAQPDYAACLQADTAGDVKKAWDSCNAAVAADPNSTSGKAAAAKLTEMKPKYDGWKKDQDAMAAAQAEQQRQADAARAKAEAETRKAAAAAARQKVEKKYYGFERDGECVDKGLPPYRCALEGGSRVEIDLVADDDGCKHLLPGRDDFLLFKVFCCPK